jgi:hypothetical protein
MIKTEYNMVGNSMGVQYAMAIKNNGCGRPAGRKKTAKIEIVVEPHIKEMFMALLHEEGKTASVEIGYWIREYIKSKNVE